MLVDQAVEGVEHLRVGRLVAEDDEPPEIVQQGMKRGVGIFHLRGIAGRRAAAVRWGQDVGA